MNTPNRNTAEITETESEEIDIEADDDHGTPQVEPGHGTPQVEPGHGTPQVEPGHGTPQNVNRK